MKHSARFVRVIWQYSVTKTVHGWFFADFCPQIGVKMRKIPKSNIIGRLSNICNVDRN